MKEKLLQIGADLAKYASESAEFSATRGVVTELFPFIYDASRTMSTRAISRWLESEHQVKLSAVTIAKALREPDKHWIAYTDELEPSVRFLEDVFNVEAKSFLLNDNVFEYMIQKVPSISAKTDEDALDQTSTIQDAIELIKVKWQPLSETTRNECLRYFLLGQSKAKGKK